MPFFSENNIKGHFEIVKGIENSLISNDIRVPYILATDATATTGRLGLIQYQNDNYLVGVDHRYDKFAPVNLVEDNTKGLKAVACLEKSEEICRATQSNSILLVPLMENSFHYCLMSFPLKDFLTNIELYELYEKLVRISKDFDIHIVSLVGDGDSRLRALQYSYIETILFSAARLTS